MLSCRVNQVSTPYFSGFNLGTVFALGLILGMAALVCSPLWVLIALVGGGMTLATLKRPEFLPLAFLVLTSTVIRVGQAPSFSIGFGTVYLTDVVFLFSLGYITAHLMRNPNFKIVRTPLDWPLLVFWGASLISTVIAIKGLSLPWKDSLNEIRVATGYLIFFAVTNLVRNKRQLALLIRGFLFLATIVALAMIAQYLFGRSWVILAGRVEDVVVEGQGEVLARGARIIPPGQSIIMVAFTAVFASSVLDKASVIRFVQCALLALALIMTFFRASWVVIGVTMVVILLLARGQERKRLFVPGLVAIALGSIVFTAIVHQPDSRAANLAHAAFERGFTLFVSGTYNSTTHSSLRWRDFEYSYALAHILANPFIGLGLGARYRPLTLRDHKNFDGRSFIHNGHIFVLLKSGVFGYLGLLWFILGVFVRGLRRWRGISEPYLRGIVLAFALTSMGVLIVSIVEPYLMILGWTPVIGIIAGINEIVLGQRSKERSAFRQVS